MSNIFSTTQPSPSVQTPEPAKKMPGLAKFLSRFIDGCLYLLAFALPLIACQRFTDAIDFSKQSVLIPVVAFMLVAWIAKVVAERKLVLTRHWMHVVVGLYGIGYLLSAAFSQDRALSFFGAPGQVVWSFATVISLIALYFVVTHQVRSTQKLYDLLFAYLGGSLFVAVFGLLQIFGVHLVGGVFQNNGINTVGTAYSLAAYLVVPLLLSAGLAFHGCRNKVCLLGSNGTAGKAARLIVWTTGVVSLAYILLVDYWLTWAIILVGAITMAVIAFARTRKVTSPVKLVIPGLLILLSVVLLAFKVPVSLNVASEVSPSATASYAIAKQALRDNVVFGTGPGTWIYDYAKYRNQLVNLSPFWNVRFDRGYSAFMTLLATTGIAGISLWLIVILSLATKAVSRLLKEKDDDTWYAYLVTFTGIVAIVFTSFFAHLGISHLFAFWLLLALLVSLAAKNTITWDKESSVLFGLLSVKLVIMAVIAISVTWLIGQRALAEMRFTNAVSQFRTNGNLEEVMGKIQSANELNPLSDVYTRNLAQANLVKAARLIQTKATDEDANKINAAIKEAVDQGIEATKVNPRNVDNWSNLGLMYQSVASFVRGADEYAIKYYSEASKLEPQNPVFLTEIGKLYLLRADAYRSAMGTTDAAKKAEAEKGVQENLALSEDFLKKAITAKPDYLAARYQLGVVYERQNRVKDAVGELEKVLVLNNKDVGVAFELSILYYRDGRKDQSRDLLEKIVQFAPDNANARWYLAALQEEQGLYEKALATLKPVQDLYPDSDAVKQRVNSISAAKAAQEAPKPQALPEPIQESIQTQSPSTPVQP
ncbi:MAG: tetratricopeptide repeat protein [Candidatus Magasanikbacteria bacterium]|nr:tetratricopeptide repeat protein [Candidatus Magasanikbacteria bacterium]MCA9391077.1 tetratricopeptide repeat protein [Candidatus Magasanikbacteria bacterium]HPF95382.1 tetratricopeptide repeat protein [bacterium]